MKSEVAPAIFFSVVMVTAAFVGVLYDAGVCSAPAVHKAIITDTAAANCFDFWINRYQTLLTGILSVTAAFVAGFLLWRQISEARRQSAATLYVIYLTKHARLAEQMAEVAALNKSIGKLHMDIRRCFDPSLLVGKLAVDCNEQLRVARVLAFRKERH
jgi:hypothetical protein